MGVPDGYYQQMCRVWLANKGVQACPLIFKSMHWGPRKNKSCVSIDMKSTMSVPMFVHCGFSFGIEVLTILILGFTLVKAQDDVVVHLPPDLRSGATLTPDQIHPANVYAFAFYIFQQLNRWPDDGAEDFGNAIFSLSAYLTPSTERLYKKNLSSKDAAVS